MFRDPAPPLPPKEVSLDRAMFASLDGATGTGGGVEKKKIKYGSVQEKRNKACESAMGKQ
jgi:hypothetical protein